MIVSERQYAFLRDESERSGLSMGELVRRAVDSTYRPFSRTRVNGFELSLGLWKRPDAAVAGRRVAEPNAVTPTLRRALRSPRRQS